MGELLVAVDVGTGSARAGVLTPLGELLGRAEYPIAMHRLDALRAEHDSDQIWQAVSEAVRGAMQAAGARPGDVAGISFDATCSLVVRGRDGEQLSVSADDDRRWDTIVWLDHRAIAEAAECTATGHQVLDYLGGVMSPEMQVPKLMWLKRHVPDTWLKAGYFFDLADFLTFKASGSLDRSQSTLTCKWTYLGHVEPGWQGDFLAEVGLSDMLRRGALPVRAKPVGTDLGPLTAEAASALGLTAACRVAAGAIDAHAGVLGALGGLVSRRDEIDNHLCLIAGTSNSVLALAPEARPIAGMWGPYYGAILPDCWLTEAGQSASGALLDHLIRWHRAGGEPDSDRHQAIADRIAVLRRAEGVDFAARLHVLPDFHGNRSPLADPAALGVISGLALDSDFDSLCRLYWRTAVALALGVRQNLEALATKGYGVGTLLLGGGHTRNELLVELYADATGCTIIEPTAPDAVLLGTAMIAAVAARIHGSLAKAATAMQQPGRPRRPDPKAAARYDRDYHILLEMQRQRQTLDRMQ
jgi:FGGY-family pentulose kinase